MVERKASESNKSANLPLPEPHRNPRNPASDYPGYDLARAAIGKAPDTVDPKPDMSISSGNEPVPASNADTSDVEAPHTGDGKTAHGGSNPIPVPTPSSNPVQKSNPEPKESDTK
jgi:hypothetical protein